MGAEFSHESCFKGLENYTHLWLLFHFNATSSQGWKYTVKAPRLGGNRTLGVFASRSTFRPNSVGMSVVKNLGWRKQNSTLFVDVEGIDLLDNTPIIDIKPYLPYADKILSSHALEDNQETLEAPSKMDVVFSPTALKKLPALEQENNDFYDLVQGVLAQDPRPAYKHKQLEDPKLYKVQLYDVDVHWRVKNQQIVVDDFTPLVTPQA